MTWHPTAPARRRAAAAARTVATKTVAPTTAARTPHLEPLESRRLMTSVAAVLFNGADAAAPLAQRSNINTISVRFDADVATSIGKADLRLWNATAGAFVDLAPVQHA